MSARKIDEFLELWRMRLSNAAQNLIDLQSDPVYKRISAPDSKLTGETAEKSAVAARTLSSLVQYFDLLQSTIGQAEELRRDMPAIFGAEERERQILGLLGGKSIHLPPVQVPLGNRSLLSGVENVDLISPAELLGVMEAAFESVKQIVLRISTAWEALGASLNEAYTGMATLQECAGQLSAVDRVDIEKRARDLQALEREATENPLGVASLQLAEFKDDLRALMTKVEDCKRQAEQARNALRSAGSTLSSLKQEHEATLAVCTEAHDKAGFVTASLGANGQRLEGLVAWFNRLVTAAESSPASSLLVAFSNWMQAAEQLRTADRALTNDAKNLLSTRRELRGRLDALKAKARAFALAENDELVSIADRATALLYRRPTPIGEAASLVSAYETKLNSQVRNTV